MGNQPYLNQNDTQSSITYVVHQAPCLRIHSDRLCVRLMGTISKKTEVVCTPVTPVTQIEVGLIQQQSKLRY
jgi:hypothetical protein